MEPNFECAAQNGAEPLCRETAAVLCIMAKSDTAMTALGRPTSPTQLGQRSDDFEKGEADGTREALAALKVIVAEVQGQA